MRKQLVLAIAAAGALLVAPTASAFASAPVTAGGVLTTGSAGGTEVAAGDTVTASLASGTTANFSSSADGSSGVTCSTSGFTATVTDNPAAPGTAGESITAQNFDDCTSNVVGVFGVDSVTVDNLPYTSTVDSTGAVSVSGALQTTVVLSTLFGTVTCVYSGSSISGTASNDGNTIAFTNQEFTLASGPGTCFGSGFFTATYGPVVDTTQGGSAVFVN